MKSKVVFCLIILFSSASSWVWSQEAQPLKNAEATSCEEEIDNFDFLYADGAYDFSGFALVNQVLDEAYKHIGTRYRLGSKGPNAFDCSGFTSYVFNKSNYSIGCSSREQYAKNMPIKPSDMRRGDLVFFTSPRSGHGVGHVGIIVDVDSATGEFTFIHASTHEGVKVNRSTDGYYGRRFVGVRRVL